MKKKSLILFLGTAILAGTFNFTVLATEPETVVADTTDNASEEANLVEASVITEVLECGETVTAIRLEYSEAIDCRAIEYEEEHPGKFTYAMVNDRDITNVYVNDSGIKDDIQLSGRYVFLNLGVESEDLTSFRDHVVFNSSSSYRDMVCRYMLFQSTPITTISGKTIAPARIETTGEIRLGIEDFVGFEYNNSETGNTLYYYLYIPEGYEAKSDSLSNLPLVVHYPAGDYGYTEYDGGYRGSLLSHPECTLWASEDVQSKNPSFVVTIGGPKVDNWSNEFEESEMQQNYVEIIKWIAATYNIDTTRIYSISTASGSTAMWETILANPDLFAAQISTAYDPYHAFKSKELAESNMAKMLDTTPGWFITGFTDYSGEGCLGEEDTRSKGERLRDLGEIMNEQGYHVNIGYGEKGELMWNGMLRGEEAAEMAAKQLEDANANGDTSLISLFIPGTVRPAQHWSWTPALSNSTVQNWLFSQINEAPAV